ncbi:hypothetical protein GCM10028803_29840 [Larkinella knui]|uniref:BLUF domain-containing protein n=1 Tax=Larkinella knui TaxID=2025310 RepID=A0A3P1CXK1_9BACT|nr:BLUF domain-containing protein [Larkinella knui]RRB18013.1 BLUF domain-containing protein [Larkinella knui]
MEYCIVYLSSSKELLSDEQLNTILHKSRSNNAALGITGILLYADGSIIQALEGPEEKVKALYQTISRDQRHLNVTKLYGNRIDHRSFGDWSMGYKVLSAKELEAIKNLNNGPSEPSRRATKTNKIVLGLIQLFYQTNFRI